MRYIDKNKLRCPRCGAPVTYTIAVNKGVSPSWVKCSKPSCRTYINTFIPMPHQMLAMEDPHRYQMVAGGYGTGKTRGDIEDRLKAAFITPQGRTLLGAPTMPQLNSTLRNDLEELLPLDFIKSYSAQQNTFTLLNDHEFLYRSFDDPKKFKSLNLTSAILVEASDSPYEAFEQLKTRLRNTAATKQAKDENGSLIFDTIKRGKREQLVPRLEADWRKIILETNPGPGWIKSEVLLKSNRLYFYHPDETYVEYFFDRTEIDLNQSSHIVPTSANYHLPPNYEEEQSRGKPKWWVERYFKGSFSYATGLVYPSFKDRLVQPFEIPSHWKRVISMDYGIRDQTFFIFLAIDEDKKRAYVYDTLVISDSSVHTIANAYKKKLEKLPFGALLKTPVMDQRSRAQRQAFNVNKTIGDLFRDEGLLFDPAQMNMEARITRTGGLFEAGQLWIFNDQIELIKQLEDYKFPEQTIGKFVKNYDKPKDSEDHGPNALEFAVMELPHNLENFTLKAYNEFGKVVSAYVTKPQSVKEYYDPFKEQKGDGYNVDSPYGIDNWNNDSGGGEDWYNNNF